MATLEQRIAQWEKMAQEAPDDMAFFSLGSAYREAERFDEAERAFARAIEMNPQMSRAYQLRGQVLLKLGREAEAGPLLTEGYQIAAARGDVMPKRAIGALLEKLGLEVPEVEEQAEQAGPVADDENTIIDRRTGQPQQRLDDPPMRGPVGQFIYDHFGQDTWRAWIAQGTKVINELRLDFSNPQHQQVYDQHMLEWLGVTEEEIEAYAQQRET